MSSRHRATTSTDHRCVYVRRDEYDISWTVDFYYPGARGRFPRVFVRDTTEKGARRFCKKWGIRFPEATTT